VILAVTLKMKEVLEELLTHCKCAYVFTSPIDPARPLGPWVLDGQMTRLRKTIRVHPGACMRLGTHFSPRRGPTRIPLPCSM